MHLSWQRYLCGHRTSTQRPPAMLMTSLILRTLFPSGTTMDAAGAAESGKEGIGAGASIDT
jgi:hypothetical protein